jgi:hypothetical protein
VLAVQVHHHQLLVQVPLMLAVVAVALEQVRRVLAVQAAAVLAR